MDFRFAGFVRFFAGTFCAAALSAAAQGGVQSDQPILYGTPKGETSQNLQNPALSSLPADQQDFSDEFQAPVSLFNKHQSSASLPAPTDNRRLDRMLRDRKNWSLMTPEEILGVTTPEKILGIETVDDINQSSLSPEQRFLLRKNQQSQSSSTDTNGYGGFYSKDNTPRWLLPKNPDDNDSPLPDLTSKSPLANFGQPMNASGNFSPFGQQDDNSGWIKSQSPVITSDFNKPTTEQKAAMERFRELLGSSAEKPQKASPGYGFGSAAVVVPNPNLNSQPDFNPAGNSFVTLEANIAKPNGIAPLPGIANPPPKLTVTPSWAPKPPPWLSQQPDPFAPLQRKF